MKTIDLTQLITQAMPVYPRTEPPHLTVANTYETDGFRETLLSFFSHTGTHMDAPFHLFGDRTKLNEMPAAQFVGKALVIPCMQYGAGEEIGMEALAPVRQLADETDFLLFETGGSRYWGTIPFPLRRSAAMRWKAAKRGLASIPSALIPSQMKG